MKKRTLGNALLILTAMFWGLAFVFKRIGMETIEPVTFTAARMWLAAFATVPVVLAAGRRNRGKQVSLTIAETRENRRATLLGGVCCGCFLAAANILQQMGVAYSTAGKSGFITAMYILFVPVIHAVIFRRRQTWIVWLAVATGLAGMYLLCVTKGFQLQKGDWLLTMCALMFAGHILCCGHFVQKSDPIQLSSIQFFTTAAVSTVVAFAAEMPTWAKIVSAGIPILYCGLISGGVGYTLQITAQRFTDPTVASLLLSLESVFAVLAGALLLKEQMSIREAAGCLAMFAAIILVQLPAGQKQRAGS